MKLCFQFDLWRPSPCHLEPAGTRERQAPVSSRHAGNIAQTWPTRRVQKSLVYPVNIKNPVGKKKTNKTNKKKRSQNGSTKLGMMMIDDCFGACALARFRTSFENLFRTLFLALFLPFTFRSSPVVHFIRRQKSPRSVF